MGSSFFPNAHVHVDVSALPVECRIYCFATLQLIKREARLRILFLLSLSQGSNV